MIYGNRVCLRRNEGSDLPYFVAWLNVPDVRRYLFLPWPILQAQEEPWFEDVIKRAPEEQPLSIQIREGETRWSIGNCGFDKIDYRVRSAEVGIFIGNKSCWNQGYGTEVKLSLEALTLNRIFLQVDEANLGAIRAYEKVGFVLEGRLRQATYRQGAYADILLMSVLRSEYLSTS